MQRRQLARTRAPVLCLLAGVVTTVLLAWVCVGWAPRYGVVDGPQGADWPRPLPGWPRPKRPLIDLGLGVRETWFDQLEEPPGGPQVFRVLRRFEGGWPLPALRADAWFETSDPQRPQSPRELLHHDGLAMVRTDDYNGGRCLPIHPLWGGFAADTGLWAAVVAAATLGVRSLRRRGERRPGAGQSP